MCEKSYHIFIESMGYDYNHLGEECKQRKQEKERKFKWVEGEELKSHIFSWRAIFTWIFMDNKRADSVEY
jgi:hypothetical protein